MQIATLTNSIIDDFAEEISVTRDDQPQTIVNGVGVPGKVRQFTMQASVQPLRGQDLLMFSEGDRVRQSVKIYSYTELVIINEKTKTKADLVEWHNTVFEVVSVETWVDGDFTYYKSIARRKDRQ